MGDKKIMILNIYPASEKILYKILSKHNVMWKEILEVFSNKHRIEKVIKDNYGQIKYACLGTAENGRYIKIIFVRESINNLKIITALDMDDSEKKRFLRRWYDK